MPLKSINFVDYAKIKIRETWGVEIGFKSFMFYIFL